MNYSAMKMLASKLLSKFGNTKTCVLHHREGTSVTLHHGFCVKLNYSSEAIGSNANIIQAGDAKVICQFDVMPVENTDIIEIAGERFNIISSGDTSPDNETKILFTLQARRTNG